MKSDRIVVRWMFLTASIAAVLLFAHRRRPPQRLTARLMLATVRRRQPWYGPEWARAV